jgi:hypothetical protein
MPVFACRWTNGDVSFVLAPSKEAAIEQLDEVDNAEGCPITQVPEFQIHLTLTDDGGFDFEGWGELTEDVVWNKLYPRLHEAWARSGMSKKRRATELSLHGSKKEFGARFRKNANGLGTKR